MSGRELGYGEAFAKLGYHLAAPRIEWSAEKPDGVCITLWEVELDPNFKKRRIDSRVNCGDISLWGRKPGNSLRRRHMSRAVAEFDGWVDVVLVRGLPGEGAKEGVPWLAHERRAKWRLTDFEQETGHFCAELVVVNSST